MTTTEQRLVLLPLVEEALSSGARLQKACDQIGLSQRTVQRWRHPGAFEGDRRVKSLRIPCTPKNKLTELESDAAMSLLNSDEFKDLPPSQIVPRLADQGQYVASESTLYRLLHVAGQMRHRRLERMPRKLSKPRALVATQPNQIYCWDITYLPAPVRGMHFYLYLFVDIFSRKVIGWQVYERESAELAAELVLDICLRHGIAPGQLIVHSDNGSPMKGETMLATLQRLGVAHSRSRPSVSNDNPYSESLFRTLKYRPQMPVKPFEDIHHARRWVTELVRWYNYEHRHSSIRFVTPTQRHAGIDKALLEKRDALYKSARQANPIRWSGSTRNWNPITEVHLNPNKPKIKEPNNILKAA